MQPNAFDKLIDQRKWYQKKRSYAFILLGVLPWAFMVFTVSSQLKEFYNQPKENQGVWDEEVPVDSSYDEDTDTSISYLHMDADGNKDMVHTGNQALPHTAPANESIFKNANRLLAEISVLGLGNMGRIQQQGKAYVSTGDDVRVGDFYKTASPAKFVLTTQSALPKTIDVVELRMYHCSSTNKVPALTLFASASNALGQSLGEQLSEVDLKRIAYGEPFEGGSDDAQWRMYKKEGVYVFEVKPM